MVIIVPGHKVNALFIVTGFFFLFFFDAPSYKPQCYSSCKKACECIKVGITRLDHMKSLLSVVLTYHKRNLT